MPSKDWLEKDYYKVLGVSKDASAADIKKAFRKLARENHPDQNPGDKAAEARFKEASEAHSVLSDADRRKEYDEARKLFGSGFKFPRSGGGRAGSTDDVFAHMSSGGLGDLFGNLFSGAQGARRTTAYARGPRRGADVEGEVGIDFVQAVEGATVSLSMVSDTACQACRGTGAKAGTMPKTCPTCEGSGMQASTAGGVFQVTEPCVACRGRGLIVDEACPSCHGSGRGKSSKTMQVRIPAGVVDGQRIRIKGRGGSGENGGAPGDLYVLVHVRPHKLFGRQGDHLSIDVPVTYEEASLGAEIKVPVLSGAPVTLRLPAGTPNGRTFRVRGKGVSRPDGTRGDLLVTVRVEVPGALSEEAKAALKSYSEAARQPDPRARLFGA